MILCRFVFYLWWCQSRSFEVELLNQRASAAAILLHIATFPSVRVVPFCTPTSSIWEYLLFSGLASRKDLGFLPIWWVRNDISVWHLRYTIFWIYYKIKQTYKWYNWRSSFSVQRKHIDRYTHIYKWDQRLRKNQLFIFTKHLIMNSLNIYWGFSESVSPGPHPLPSSVTQSVN